MNRDKNKRTETKRSKKVNVFTVYTALIPNKKSLNQNKKGVTNKTGTNWGNENNVALASESLNKMAN